MRRAPLLLLLCAVVARADAPTGQGGGGFTGPMDELSPAERSRIQAMIDANVADLRLRGVFAATPKGAVLFTWPISTGAGFVDYDVHGISNFVDQDPANPGSILDYTCGSRTYDINGYNHSGTDIFTWPFGWLRMDSDEVTVVAAAPGVIAGKDDGNFDRSCAMSGARWNAVYVRHADGTIAWYGHLKNGSPTTKAVGDTVARGEYLGVVGSSGSSTGPHLHFEVHDAADALVDPFAGACNALNASSCWQAQRPYYDSAINRVATSFAPPDFGTCPAQEIPNEQTHFPFGATIYFIGYYHDQLSGQPSDTVLRRPDGSAFTSYTDSSTVPHYSASYWYHWWTSFAPAGPAGRWTQEVTYQGRTYRHPFWLCSGSPIATDTDGDGTADECDACPAIADASQLDTDDDGMGDACDGCPLVQETMPADTDGDGVNDACDPSCDPEPVDVRVARSGTDVVLNWTAPLGATYDACTGTIPALMTMAARALPYDHATTGACDVTPSLRMTTTPGDSYFVVGRRCGGPSSSFGMSSLGDAVPPASPQCP